jgi:hypothetical protein
MSTSVSGFIGLSRARTHDQPCNPRQTFNDDGFIREHFTYTTQNPIWCVRIYQGYWHTRRHEGASIVMTHVHAQCGRQAATCESQHTDSHMRTMYSRISRVQDQYHFCCMHLNVLKTQNPHRYIPSTTNHVFSAVGLNMMACTPVLDA